MKIVFGPKKVKSRTTDYKVIITFVDSVMEINIGLTA